MAAIVEVVAGWHAAAVALELAAETGAEDDRAGEGDHAAHRVHHGRAGEVAEAHAAVGGLQEAARAPGPVAEDRVDEAADGEAVEQVALEVGASDHRPRRDRRAGVGEGELEQEERHERDAGVGRPVEGVRRRGAVEEEELVADDAVAEAEHEGEAERPEQQRAQARVDDALLEDVDDLTGPGEAGLEHHEAGLHEEHEERGDKGPGRVDAVDRAGQRALPSVGSTCYTFAAPARWPITHGAAWVMTRKNSPSPSSLPPRNVTKNFCRSRSESRTRNSSITPRSSSPRAIVCISSLLVPAHPYATTMRT